MIKALKDFFKGKPKKDTARTYTIQEDLCLRVKNLEDTLDGMRMEYTQYLIDSAETQEMEHNKTNE